MLRILDHAAVSEEERRQARRGEREVGAEDKEAMDKEPKDKEVVVVEESGAVEREKRRSEEEMKKGGGGGKDECDGLSGRWRGSKVQQESSKAEGFEQASKGKGLKEGCDGLMWRWKGSTDGSKVQHKRQGFPQTQDKRQGFPQASLESKDIRKDPDTAMEATGAKKLSTLLKNLQ